MPFADLLKETKKETKTDATHQELLTNKTKDEKSTEKLKAIMKLLKKKPKKAKGTDIDPLKVQLYSSN